MISLAHNEYLTKRDYNQSMRQVVILNVSHISKVFELL